MVFNLGTHSGPVTGAPKLTYKDDNGNVITQYRVTEDGANWEIELLANGNITFQNLRQQVDVFAVGGGGGGCVNGGGGGGGFTKTVYKVSIDNGETIPVTIGKGGIGGSSGGATSFGEIVSATGGSGGGTVTDNWSTSGGSGGSGGGAFNTDSNVDKGGWRGINGADGHTGRAYIDKLDDGGDIWWYSYGGKGQGKTTGKFGEDKGGAVWQYFGQGGWGINQNGSDDRQNSGNGGHGGQDVYLAETQAYDGIIIIRNARS